MHPGPDPWISWIRSSENAYILPKWKDNVDICCWWIWTWKVTLGQIAIDHDTMNVQSQKCHLIQHCHTLFGRWKKSCSTRTWNGVCCSNLKRCVKRIGINESHHSAGCNLILWKSDCSTGVADLWPSFPSKSMIEPKKKHKENANSIQPSNCFFTSILQALTVSKWFQRFQTSWRVNVPLTSWAA